MAAANDEVAGRRFRSMHTRTSLAIVIGPASSFPFSKTRRHVVPC